MKFEFSAGGVVYKHEKPLNENTRNATKNIVVLVAQHSQHHGWVFPKGLIGGQLKGQKKSASAKGFGLRLDEVSLRPDEVGETREEAALREVREETGIDGKIIKPLTPVTYWYAFGGDPSTGSGREKIKKTVYYFLMEYVSGDTKDHDFEMENVEWLAMEEVENRLTYKSDKEVWKEAKETILSF